MNKLQKMKIKRLLIKKREETVDKIKQIKKEGALSKSQRDAAGDLSGYSIHMADAGTDAFDRDMQLNYASAEQKVLFEIDSALKGLKEKNFGRCQSCGSSIKMKRLLAVPYAKLCIKCQEKEDKSRV